MKTLLESIVKALVDFPEQVDIREVDGERVLVFEIRLNADDIRKVIGKQGRTITSIRTIMNGIASKAGKRLMLEIIEPLHRAQPAPASPVADVVTPDAPEPDAGIDFGATTSVD